MGILSPRPPSEPTPPPAAGVAENAHADAQALLRRFNVTCTQVVSVDSDSILFSVDSDSIGFTQMARTAWIGMRDGRVVTVQVEDGFNAEPNGWTAARLARACDPSSPAAGPSENTD